MGNCVCLMGWIDPETNREIRGVLEETRGTIRDARTYAKEKKPQVEAVGQKVAESAQEAAQQVSRQAGPVAEEIKSTAAEALPKLSTPPMRESCGRRGGATPATPPPSESDKGRPVVYTTSVSP